MANINISDMFARKLLYSALRSMSDSAANSTPRSSLTLAQLANLSTYDRPAAPTLEENAYYSKYKDRLEKIKQTKPEEYEAALDKIYGKKPSKPTEKPLSDVQGSSMLSKMASSSKSEQNDQSSSESQKRKDLDSIVKLDLLREKSAEEISQIWSQHYAGKDGVVFATVPVDKYTRLKVKGKEFPLFIYPLPRETGFEFMLGQCSEDDWYYTPLISYQTHGEYAPYSLAIHYYPELAESKGIVLMMGEICAEELKPELATLLALQTQLIYGSDENLELVKLMHEKPDDFQHMEVINVCKKAGLF